MRLHVFLLLLLYYGTEIATAGVPLRMKTLTDTHNQKILDAPDFKEWTSLIMPHREPKSLTLYKDVELEVHRRATDAEQPEAPKHPDVFLRFTRQAASFYTEQITSAAREKLIRRRLDNITLSVLQLNVTLHSISIADITFPTIDYEKIGKNKIRASSSGGEVRLQGQYRSVYRTVREGQFEALIRGFNVEVDVLFERTEDGRVKLLSDECKPAVGSVHVDLKPFLIDDALEAIHDRLLATIKSRICEVIDLYIHVIDKHIPSNEEHLPLDFEIGFADGQRISRHLRPTTAISLAEDSLDMVLQPAKHTGFLSAPAPLASEEDDVSRMIYVYLSERYTKPLLTPLFTIPNSNFKLHGDFGIDAVGCDSETNVPSCKPSLFGPKPMRFCRDSGRLRTWQRKHIGYEATDEGAKLRLLFSTAVTFDNYCAARPVIVANFDLTAEVVLESVQLTVDTTDSSQPEREYRLEPSIYVEHVEISNARYFLPMHDEIETRIVHDFPVRLMHDILDNMHHATVHTAALFGANSTLRFRHHTAVLSLDLPKSVRADPPTLL